MKLFIAWAGDHVLRELDRMAMRSDAEGIRRATRLIERGNETLKSWLEATDGQIISMDNAGGRAQMQADHLHELEGMRDRYREIVGTSASVGIGSTVAEAEIGLKAARLRGGDRALIFSPQMEDELAQNADKLMMLDKAEPEAELDKAEAAKQPTISKPKGPTSTSGDHSQEDAIYHLLDESERNAPPSPEHTHAARDFEDYLHEAAQKQDQEDSRQAQNAHQEALGVRKQVAQVLQALRQQAPVLEQLKGQAPQIYQAVTAMTQSVITMARLLTPQDQPAGQPIQKALGDVKPGQEVHPGVFDYSHVLPEQHRAAGYGLLVHHNGPRMPAPQQPGRLGRMFGKKPIQPPMQFSDGPVKALAQLTHGGKVVGGLDATQNQGALRIGESIIKDPQHRGGGKGTAMYEALLSHAKNVGGAKYAFGDVHSTSASIAHQRLAGKHGLEYVPQQNPRTAAHPVGDYDKKYLPYNYTLKVELPASARLAQTIGMVPGGPQAPEGYTDDFSHVRAHVMASDPHSGGGLRSAAKFGIGQIRPDDYWWPKEPMPFDPNDSNIDAGEPASPQDVERYAAQNRQGSAPPAVFGVKRGHRTLLLDGKHRRAAAQAAGTPLTGYIGRPKMDKPDDWITYERHPEGGYRRFNHQTKEWLKTEMQPTAAPPPAERRSMEKAFEGLPLPHAPKRTNLHLPVGTTIESTGRFKVMTPTGKTKWKQGRVGVIMSKQPETAAADYGHPTSSREPNN